MGKGRIPVALEVPGWVDCDSRADEQRSQCSQRMQHGDPSQTEHTHTHTLFTCECMNMQHLAVYCTLSLRKVIMCERIASLAEIAS